MSKIIKLRKVGNSVGVILPRDQLARLNVKDGDPLYIVETEKGIELTPYDPDFDAKMKAFERTSSKYRNALQDLAK
ncbi:MAG: AbrB/MazE/SpoVT family DNA-binding domain-containing protein [Proteobacteria bacterium]|nr:AbrB/MazE/SpoVT family DNA-binding domain-containing protein [Pseudomonadota bacterium]